MTTQEILNIIREKAGLKRLEFGCRFNVFTSERIVMEIEGNEVKNLAIGSNIVFSNTIENINNSENIEIIGLPPQLNDLLRVIEDEGDRITLYGNEVLYSGEKVCNYDLSKTVEQNLETNPELRELISNLIK